MAKANLLLSACTVALLAASPVLAQTNTQTESTGPDNSVNAPTQHEPSPGSTSMSPSATTGMHRHSAMGGAHMMHERQTATSQNAEVDRLNEQSLAAAQRGQAYGSTGTMSNDMSTQPSGAAGSGSMNDMSGGTMKDQGTPAGTTGSGGKM